MKYVDVNRLMNSANSHAYINGIQLLNICAWHILLMINIDLFDSRRGNDMAKLYWITLQMNMHNIYCLYTFHKTQCLQVYVNWPTSVLPSDLLYLVVIVTEIKRSPSYSKIHVDQCLITSKQTGKPSMAEAHRCAWSPGVTALLV